MAFKNRPAARVDFSDILTTLNRTNTALKNPALYQAISQLIAKSQQNKAAIYTIIDQFFGEIIINDDTDLSAILEIIQQIRDIIQYATFWTRNDEHVRLPSSINVIEGPGIDLDYTTTVGSVIISASGTTPSGGAQLHGLQRILGDGATTTFNLLDIAEYLEHVGVNGLFRDPALFSLSSNRNQIIFASAPGAGEVIAIEYVVATM